MKRRAFLKTGITALTSYAVGYRAFAASGERLLRVGLIGSGWYGKTDLYALCQVAPVDVVALCDPDSNMLDEAAERAKKWQRATTTPHKYRDYRQMLAEHELDVAIVATPDHWHALPTIEAIERGIDVYCQKPISVDVREGQAMVAAARHHGRVVQVGTQRRSTPHLVQAVNDIIKPGKLGRIGHVEICCYYHMRSNKKVEDTAAPPHLDFDLWTGPAPMRPYNPLIHPKKWRLFWEYSNGIVGDMCVHMLDMVRWMLDLGWPDRVYSTGGTHVDRESTASITDTQVATFEYPGFDVTWTHRTWGTPPDPAYPWAAFIYGEKGTLKASVSQWDFVPHGDGESVHRDVLQEFDRFPQDLKEKDLAPGSAVANRRHQQDFLEAVRERTNPVADIEQGYISTASCILANLSMQLARPLKWNATRHDVVDDPEASKLLSRPYRQPWVHPYRS